MSETPRPPGILKTIAAIFGGSVVGGAVAFFLTLAMLLGSVKKKHMGDVLGPDGFFLGAAIGGAVTVGILILGFAAWMLYGRKDQWLAREVDELWENGVVRFFGVTISMGAAFAVLFVVAEYSFATEEYPPKWNEMPEFVLGGYILSAIVYLFLAGVVWIARKLAGRAGYRGRLPDE